MRQRLYFVVAHGTAKSNVVNGSERCLHTLYFNALGNLFTETGHVS
jgi:hypothetical protein